MTYKLNFGWRSTHVLSVLLAIVFIYLVLRNCGLYPSVFADEYAYNLFSRIMPFSQVNRPNYLYYAIYQITNLAGHSSLECARFLNALFFVLAAPFIYLIGKKLTGKKTAIFIAVFSVLGPINTYTAYFMPESLYFMWFWIFSYLTLNVNKESSLLYWLLMGIIFSFAALTKPHALFLLPALSLYFYIIQRQFVAVNPLYDGRYLKYFGFFLFAITTKLLLGYLLAGSGGITFLGSDYSSVAAGAAGRTSHYIHLLLLSFENIQGHLLAMCLLFSVPLAHLIFNSNYFFMSGQENTSSRNLTIYTFLVLASLILMAVLFTATVDHVGGPYETNDRLHMRYYNFAFPLLWLAIATKLPSTIMENIKIKRLLITILIGTAICYAVYHHVQPFTPSIIDNPEFFGFIYNIKAFYFLSTLSFLSLIIWAFSLYNGRKVFIYVFMPLTVLISTYYAHIILRARLLPSDFDQAGIFASQFIPKKELSSVLVVSSDLAASYRTLFYLDNSQASFTIIEKDAPYDLTQLPPNKRWLIIVGNHVLSPNKFSQIPMDGFSLIHISK